MKLLYKKRILLKNSKKLKQKKPFLLIYFILILNLEFENKSTEFEILKKFIENIKKIISDKFKIWIIFDNIKIYKQILILSKIDMMKEIEFFFLYQSVIKIIV